MPDNPAEGQAPLRLGAKTFAPSQPVLMAIVNRTPDSFYDAGATYALDTALRAADLALSQGADILDIGGVKAGKGEPVSVSEEIDRVVPVIEAVIAAHPEAVISVDTWRSEVAAEAARAGAGLINDCWEGHDPLVAFVAARAGIGLVCTHAGHLAPRTDPDRPDFGDLMGDVTSTLAALTAEALEAGVRADAICIDPGHDMGKTTSQTLEITRRIGDLVATGWPVMVAVSNKDFIGETLDLDVNDRLAGTLAVTATCAWLGARVFRAHQVKQTKEVLDMVASIRGDRPPIRAIRGLGFGRDDLAD
ncbi:MAG: dihydropteroate synthase, partial [Acidimicrobiales bacterium]